MATDFVYDLKAKSLSSLVPPATAISLARSIVADLDGTWTKCSKYNKAQGISVQTYSRHLYGEKWSARKSVHDVPWEWFMSGLCEDHTKNELEYIHDFNSYKEVDGGESGWKGVISHYKMGGILSDRETPVWLFAKQPDLNVREFFVISTPAEFESTPGRVKAAFSAIEHVQELPDGKIQWVMALVSDGGGLVPKWIQDIALPKIISNDVPSFLAWAKNKYATES
ncbi:uncharacterized protein V2V93DRAFT_367166 [Kockiozyma suomiensis]|uniref:uncharacterized protein n=1 Tax=Kockiozyma suomiensis TaxID=1337062 RepID=UPI00334398CF